MTGEGVHPFEMYLLDEGTLSSRQYRPIFLSFFLLFFSGLTLSLDAKHPEVSQCPRLHKQPQPTDHSPSSPACRQIGLVSRRRNTRRLKEEFGEGNGCGGEKDQAASGYSKALKRKVNK